MIPETVNIEFSKDELNVILAALGKQPYTEVFTVINKILNAAQEAGMA